MAMAEVRRQFDMVLPEAVFGLSLLFRDAGFKLYVVGGAVRDALLGEKPKDFDLATDATPDQVIQLLEGTNWLTTAVGKSFGVVVAQLNFEGIEPGWARSGRADLYEIATFRIDIGEGRHPSAVVFSTIEHDVMRRDLTVNAMFYDVLSAEVVDLVGGLADMEMRLIRAVGNPEDRFREDPLRVLRAIRFAARLGWAIEDRTWDAIRSSYGLRGVSADRIHNELSCAVASAKDVSYLLELLDRAMLWPLVLPGLRVTTFRSDHRLPVLLALLLDDNDPELVAKMLHHARYSDLEVRQASFLLRFRGLTVSNAHRLRKAFDAAHMPLNDVVAYAQQRCMPDPKLVAAFRAYVFAQRVSGEELLAAGLSGAALGKELERRETEAFQALVQP